MISTQEIYKRLKDKGLSLPKAAAPAANYVPYVLSGNQLYISGQLPFLNGQENHIGRLGDTYNIEQGQAAARDCALNILGQVDSAVNGDWSKVKRCIKLGGFVNSTNRFHQQPAVINGASDLIADILGDAGRHTRFAVSVVALPFGAAVEIDGLFEINA
tara:strand:- start:104081 stop:104557 length:477 start_codon:yes stop_codon:yes gene_type:complete